MTKISKITALGIMALAAGVAAPNGDAVWREARAQAVQGIDARVVAVNIPGASAIAQIGTFVPTGTELLTPGNCTNPSPIPTHFAASIQPGAVLDPNRLLVGSRSNFGAPLPASGGLEGSLLSIDPNGKVTLVVPATFDSNGDQEATHGGAVQMFSANSPHWLNGVNNPNANTAQYTGVGNPLGLSNITALGVSGRQIRRSA
jgi:hypothetical protein